MQRQLHSLHTVLFLLILPFTFALSSTEKQEQRMKEFRDRVVEMFQHAYESYMSHAYPLDELRPLSCEGADTWGSFSLTLIDALDTMLVIGNISEFQCAYDLVISHPSFNIDVNTSVFEANIRVVGGLLSAHLLSPVGQVALAPGWPCEGPLLSMAESLARRLLPAFSTPTGLPYGTINLRHGVPVGETPITCTACCSSFLVEFGTLSRLTGDPVFEKVAVTAVKAISARRSTKTNLPGNHINVLTGQWTADDFTVGNYIDSYLEYLVKGAVLLDIAVLMETFQELMASILEYTEQGGWFTWVNKDLGKRSLPFIEALDAYWPGLMSMVGELQSATDAHLHYFMLWRMFGGLPEIFNFARGKPHQDYEAYRLRPELAEAAWYLHRATGNPVALEVGYSMVEAIDKIARVPCGFATVKSTVDHKLLDRMESYFLAETLKYLYLLFTPDHWLSLAPQSSLNMSELLSVPGGQQLLYHSQLLKNGCSVGQSGYVLNTEAHPIDVGALHCCQHRLERTGSKRHQKMAPRHGCPAPPFHSRLELFTAKIKPV